MKYTILGYVYELPNEWVKQWVKKINQQVKENLLNRDRDEFVNIQLVEQALDLAAIDISTAGVVKEQRNPSSFHDILTVLKENMEEYLRIYVLLLECRFGEPQTVLLQNKTMQEMRINSSEFSSEFFPLLNAGLQRTVLIFKNALLDGAFSKVLKKLTEVLNVFGTARSSVSNEKFNSILNSENTSSNSRLIKTLYIADQMTEEILNRILSFVTPFPFQRELGSWNADSCEDSIEKLLVLLSIGNAIKVKALKWNSLQDRNPMSEIDIMHSVDNGQLRQSSFINPIYTVIEKWNQLIGQQQEKMPQLQRLQEQKSPQLKMELQFMRQELRIAALELLYVFLKSLLYNIKIALDQQVYSKNPGQQLKPFVQATNKCSVAPGCETIIEEEEELSLSQAKYYTVPCTREQPSTVLHKSTHPSSAAAVTFFNQEGVKRVRSTKICWLDGPEPDGPEPGGFDGSCVLPVHNMRNS